MISAPTNIAGLSNPAVIIQSKKPPSAGIANPKAKPHNTFRHAFFCSPTNQYKKIVPTRGSKKKKNITNNWSPLTLPLERTSTSTGTQVNRLQTPQLFRKLVVIGRECNSISRELGKGLEEEAEHAVAGDVGEGGEF
jgi:hypothetical protein